MTITARRRADNAGDIMAGEKVNMDEVDDRLAKIYTFKGDKRAQYDQTTPSGPAK